MAHGKNSDSAFYGRRKGKPLREKQADLCRDLLPLVRFSSYARPSSYDETWLEIGFGGGEHLIATAAANPNVWLIGCEPFVNGVAKALSQMSLQSIQNISIHDDDVLKLLDDLPPNSLSRVFILYPDPWPKLRHRKRRLISNEFLIRLSKVMAPGAELRFATDIDDYAAWTLARIVQSEDFTWVQDRPEQWLVPWAGWTSTRYESKAFQEGRSPVYLTFNRL
jgi:tRNA (guanine-N7-)-methyltransferase